MHPTTDDSSDPGRVDSSLSLLTRLTAETLDPGYAHAAARRARAQVACPDGSAQPHASGLRTRSGRAVLGPRGLRLLGLIGVSVLLTVAAVHERDRAAAVAAEHRGLVTEVEKRLAGVDRLAAQVGVVRTQVSAQRSALLLSSSAGAKLSARLATLDAVTGVAPLHGPGLVLTITDAPGVDATAPLGPRTSTGASSSGRVIDQDLQIAANGLWQAGAEAIAVNGVRLTALSSIRSAGGAILVDYRPISPPYRFVAIADPGLALAAYQNSTAAGYFALLAASYGIGSRLITSRQVSVPGTVDLTLRYASPAPTPSPAPTGAGVR